MADRADLQRASKHILRFILFECDSGHVHHSWGESCSGTTRRVRKRGQSEWVTGRQNIDYIKENEHSRAGFGSRSSHGSCLGP